MLVKGVGGYRKLTVLPLYFFESVVTETLSVNVLQHLLGE